MALGSFPAIAKSVRTELQISPQMAGTVKDGAILAKGRVFNADGAEGFTLWMEAASPAGAPGYIIQSETDPTKKIRVRLAGRDWQVNPLNKNSMISIRPAPSAAFLIVADGQQNIPAGSWRLLVSAAPGFHENRSQ
ncbi:hypothetical protein BTJ39_07800 [Izhakiella australiensis]|uniref:Invasin n=1 Tax=Izhakiella australiensis TaxID=1926881 RepID=A0A1S8YQ95_9GAMM|nr:AfaD family invasin [Izhakiella australiensis]OON40956.1 hypothetical protein BTJ39_07800 [Izhakiella australiensis]